jgi:hypothetical protein
MAGFLDLYLNPAGLSPHDSWLDPATGLVP